MPINVNLTPQLEEMVRQKVRSGMYTSASEVVREALRLMQEKERYQTVKFDRLRQDIRDGIQSGEPCPWNPEEVKRTRPGKKSRQTRLTMPAILRRPIVIDDLAEIWNYIAAENEIRADSLIDTFDWKFQELAECPIIGNNRDELYKGLMSLPVGRYIVFYLNVPAGIEIVRVLHAARDLSFQFGPPA